MSRMNDQATSEIVQRLRDEAHPWVPMGVPPQRHYHHFPDGLSICFTQDVLPWGTFWHLSVRRPGGLTEEDLRFWPRAFFDADPEIRRPGVLFSEDTRHFFWGKKDDKGD